ncbi:MAG: hypothetical protein KGJ79_13535 [Alphaproteobacteria bacterium]|nr:hypothetical protein [Alphaproteobacteria bacterium]MDE2112160.1 hypothetical protein [Alphaproteobacteria bacterium]MDE2495791.1 hypothetical protein [Alphaproteobacteria bacterium]
MRKNGHPLAKTVWLLGLSAFAAPAAAAAAILGVGRYDGCVLGAAACSRLPELGAFFKHALDISWILGMNATALIPLALMVALAAIMARSPARAFIGVFGGPTIALFLPVLVVMSAVYPGCHVDEGGGSCTFWGVPMGDSFTSAAVAPWLAYIIPPVGFAAALAVMAVAYIVKRQRA